VTLDCGNEDYEVEEVEMNGIEFNKSLDNFDLNKHLNFIAPSGGKDE
jgi:predicted nucleic-acid-binding Zn-ribbon protein